MNSPRNENLSLVVFVSLGFSISGGGGAGREGGIEKKEIKKENVGGAGRERVRGEQKGGQTYGSNDGEP